MSRQDTRVGWKPSRYGALVVVLAVHLGIVAVLLLRPSAPLPLDSSSPPLEVVLLPQEVSPTPKSLASALPRHLLADIGIAIAPPSLDAPALAAPASQGGGDGSGVNWVAEAHRAVKAFEIRRDQQVMSYAFALSAEDAGVPGQKHHPGDRSRTENGDWIVWIDGNCYQVASWHDGAPPQDAAPPKTICTSDAHR